MGEIEEGVNETPPAGDAAGAPVPVPGGSLFSFEEEPGPEVLEGLAEEDISGSAAATQVNTLGDFAGPVPRAAVASVQNAVRDLGETLGKRLDSLQAVFDRELRAEATRERVIDRLHAELQEYKQYLLLKIQRPIFIDLIQLHDDVGKMIASRDSAAVHAEDASGVRVALESVQTAIEDILYRQGVEPFSIDANEFDPRRQRAISTQTTEDPALNKTVAARLRKGFQAGEKLIRPEMHG